MRLFMISLNPFARRRRLSALNETAPAARPVRACSAINEQLGALGAEEWIRVTPYGRFPVVVQVDGRSRQVIQNVDRAAAEAMVGAFNSLATAVGTLGRGLPIFEGHADHPEWLARNPAARKAAVGRIKKLEARDDGLYALPAFNSIGDSLVRGEAPAYEAQSPHWNLELIGPRASSREARPTVLRSIALTNTPNIPGNVLGLNEDDDLPDDSPETTTTMNKALVLKLLAALGQTIAEDASPEALDAALAAATTKAGELATTGANMASEKTALEAKATAYEEKATTAANEAVALKTSLAAERSARTGVVVDAAVKAGKIPEAKRAEWVTALNEAPDFAAKASELDKTVPAINTSSKVGGLAGRRDESAKHTAGIAAINEAVAAHMKSTGLTNRDLAWSAVKAAKPELFK